MRFCGWFFLLFFVLNSYAIEFNFKSFETDFKQIVYDNQQNLVYEGKIYYKNQKSLWEYKKPDEKRIYINNSYVLVVDDDLEQVVISKENINLAKILKNITKINKNQYIAIYQNIKYTILTDDKFIKTIKYKDELDNQVEIDFYNSQININIDDKKFEYEIPKNYDVIR